MIGEVGRIVRRAAREPEFRQSLYLDRERALSRYRLSDADKREIDMILRAEMERLIGTMVVHRVLPIRVGRRVVSVPPGQAVDLPGDAIPIAIGGAVVFGNGTHPSTRLSVQMLEDLVTPGCRVLDIGTGTGILAIASAKLGARDALALDIDPDCVSSARENIAANGVQDAVRVEEGSVSEALGRGPFDVVVANMLPHVLNHVLGDGLADTLKPGGRLIMAGMRTHEAPPVRRAARRAGLRVTQRRTINGWVGFVLRRAHALPGFISFLP